MDIKPKIDRKGERWWGGYIFKISISICTVLVQLIKNSHRRGCGQTFG
jgi:hypothetical protein